MKYLEVAVCAPISHTLIYGPPRQETVALVTGLRLLVPLAGRMVTGYLVGFADQPPVGVKISPIAEVLDPAPLFPEQLIPFFKWIAEYYQHPIGDVLKTALPGGLDKKSSRRLVLTEKGRSHFSALMDSDLLELQESFPWLEELLQKGSLSVAATAKIWKGRGRQLMENWSALGWVLIEAGLVGGDIKVRREMFVGLPAEAVCAGTGTGSVGLGKSEQKTLETLGRILAEEQWVGEAMVPVRELTRAYPGSRKVLSQLLEKNCVRQLEKEVYQDLFGGEHLFYDKPEQLTEEQETVLSEFLPAVRCNQYSTFLLHGITGSGKTEVYLRAAAQAMEQGRTVLILVPEIALSSHLEAHFISRFGGECLAVLHSGLTRAERFQQWMRIVHGEVQVVIGARSAVFAPLRHLGLIVVDEEHDGAYKQESGLRYNARDLAVLRGSFAQAPVLLGSATPSVVSYYHATQGKYHLLCLTRRIDNRTLPAVKIIDLKNIKTVSGQPPIFSPDLVVALRETLARGEQSLIFLNRRGYANFMLCRQCGHTVSCPHCHVSLTLHRMRNELTCHYCGYVSKSDLLCPQCVTGKLVGVGFGTERIEHELKNLFPAARIARLDRDTCRKRMDFVRILKTVHQGQVDMLLGTQMIAKGHHFPNVTLVGIVWADAGLGLPDFRAGERTFQIISQVAGRAGRGERPGRVLVQTHMPSHYSIETARTHNYEEFFIKEIAIRQEHGFPPFSRIVVMLVEGEVEDLVRAAAEDIGRAGFAVMNLADVQILGPAPAPLERLRGKYRWQVFVCGPSRKTLQKFHDLLWQKISPKKYKGVTIVEDFDPESML